MATPNDKELAVLKQFREKIQDIRLNDYQRTDEWLLRWLRARELNVDRANRMLRSSLEWRAKEGMDSILSWEPPAVIGKEFPMKLCGYDMDGCPIGLVPFGRWDIRRVIEQNHKKDFVRYVDQLFEFANKLMEHRSNKSKVITQFVMIMDMDHFSYRQIASRETIDAIFETIKRFEANHPETLKAAYLVNAPRVFAYLFSFIKPLLTARTLSKVQIFSSNGSQWKAVLLKNIQPDQLAAELGGSNTTCPAYVAAETFDHVENTGEYESFADEDFQEATVGSGKDYVHCVTVEEPGTRLSWAFKTLKHDIGFSVVSPDGKTLVKVARADANNFTQKGSITCEEAGEYQLVFDNSFSRMRSKQLYFAYNITSQPLGKKPNNNDRSN